MPDHTNHGPHVIETRDLTRRYGEITAVDTLNLTVRRGEVYGFLGPNGAGKTTTLRMLLGLIRPTSGGIAVLGSSPGSAGSLARTGAMIETPAFYPHLSGGDNLRVLARYAAVDASRIDLVLDQVRLLDRAGDVFREYSLGMKQRLGVAAALLKDPELLILDEPTNGLDPAGMTEMRALIRELGQGNRTVLLSSHLMHEVEQTCDRAGIIAAGRLVAEGTIDDLLGEDALVVRAEPTLDAMAIARDIAGVRRASLVRGAIRIKTLPGAELDPAYLNARLVGAGVAVRELRLERASLESVFLDLTNPNELPARGDWPGHPDGNDTIHDEEVADVA